MPRGLGEFEQLLLFAILRLGDGAYGVRIRREIARQSGKETSAGAVYTGLDRLQSRGYISVRTGESSPSRRGGGPRKYYRLEPEGARALHATYQNVTRMAEGMLGKLKTRAAIEGDR